MVNYATHVSRKATPQNEQARADQVENNAGGFTFAVDDWTRLDRFLILGAEGGTYYVNERKLTKENASCVMRLLQQDGPRVVARTVEISESGRAPKNDPAIFVLALASADMSENTRKAAFAALPRVCRIGTHLFLYAAMVDELRGWGTALRRAVANWYDQLGDGHKLLYQLVKYRQRNGWSHRDLLRLAHVPHTDARAPIWRWVVGAELGDREVKGKADRKRGDRQYRAVGALPEYLAAFDELQKVEDPKQAVKLIQEHRFTHEMLPKPLLKSSDVWAALLPDMPIGAVVRNLGKLSQVGVIAPLSDGTKTVVAKLTNPDILKKGRVHPIALMSALYLYRSGKGVKGKLTWNPERAVLDALNEAFYTSFGTIEPTGKNHLLALDVSASMTWPSSLVAGLPGLHAREVAGGMAMVTARTEPNYHITAFSNGISPVSISPTQRLDDVLSAVQSMWAGGTDCALPMLYALQNRIPVDVFVVYTDNESWAGTIHVHQALEQYRQKMGRDAKLIVAATAATEFSVADPNDAGQLDVVGFDASAPSVMADFARG